MTYAKQRKYLRNECIVFHKTKEKYGGLSNMASGFPLYINGVKILSSEALYQLCRFPHRSDLQKLIIEERSPMTAKMISKKYSQFTRSDWNLVVIDIMRWCLKVKLAHNWNKFGNLLLSTKDLQIVEQSTKNGFWGAKPKDDETLLGANILGQLLIELRNELRKPTIDSLKVVHPLDIRDFLFLDKPIGRITSQQNQLNLNNYGS